MYHILEARVREALRAFIQRQYSIEAPVVTERPPRIDLGEVATPVCFELAKRLKRAPRHIAQEIVAAIGPVEGVSGWAVAGGGYINAYFDRGHFFTEATRTTRPGSIRPPQPGADSAKVIVEHTNINPNKAAHIGHLRNAVLGDTFVRLLRHAGRHVEVQNYIDNTGVQVADVVVGLMHLDKKSPAEVRAMAAQPRFDYHCWDLYARVTQWLEEDPQRQAFRAETLRAIEHDEDAPAQIAETLADAMVRCHLRTMERVRVEYDVLPRESEILRLKFWDAAFAQLRERGVIRQATRGKNKDCWVMRMDGPGEDRDESSRSGESGDDDAKIIVRSNGTVTYVGKDIAYQMWKFGLLGRDFHYQKFHTHPSGHVVWASCANGGEPAAPSFGRGAEVYNVIDARQSYLQSVVIAGLRAMGYQEQAQHSTHFAYEMVALSPRCAREMGYELSEEEARRPHVDVSGRKGRGVKADDLIDRLEAGARAEVDARHPDVAEAERAATAHQIAIAALRYFLLRYTRNAVIAFDFKDALSFEGETGPYCQYAVVRARNIFRKLREQQPDYSFEAAARELTPTSLGTTLASPAGDDLWELLLLAGSLETHIEKGLGAQEPAFVAKYAFQLAQAFNLFYHRHHILSEEDPARKAFLVAVTRLLEQQLVAALGLMGIEAPERM